MSDTDELTGYHARLLPHLLEHVDANRRDHATAATGAPTVRRGRHVKRWAWAAGSLTVLTSSAITFTLFGTGTSQAFAVDTLTNGQVKISIDNKGTSGFTQTDALQKALRAHGVTSNIVKTHGDGCPNGYLLGVAGARQVPRPAADGLGFTIDPGTTGSVVNLLVASDEPGTPPLMGDTSGLPHTPPAFEAGTHGLAWVQLGCTNRPAASAQPSPSSASASAVPPSAQIPTSTPHTQPSR